MRYALRRQAAKCTFTFVFFGAAVGGCLTELDAYGPHGQPETSSCTVDPNADDIDFQIFDHEEGCFVFVKNKLTWLDAENFCANEDMHLISIRTSSELDRMKRLLEEIDADRWWTGGYDWDDEGNYKWSNGDDWTTEDLSSCTDKSNCPLWGDDRPTEGLSNFKNDCVVLSEMKGFKLDDTECNDEYSFVCAKMTQ